MAEAGFISSVALRTPTHFSATCGRGRRIPPRHPAACLVFSAFAGTAHRKRKRPSEEGRPFDPRSGQAASAMARRSFFIACTSI